MNDFFENVPYNHPQFPIFIEKEKFFSSVPFASHINWHNDIEFVKILSGSINYCINGENIKLSAGEGLYINSNQIHYNSSSDNDDCIFLCIVFHPAFLCTKKYYEEEYILPVLTNPTLPYYIFKEEILWEKQILDCIEKIYNNMTNTEFELELYSAFFNIWANMYKNLGKKKVSTINHETVDSFKKMVSYIQLHYKEKITLEDIASSGIVCKTTCNKIFKIFTGCSPVKYLTEHRLRRAIELMKNSNLNLTQICYECGFCGTSYFSETFKNVFGYSPSAYKKQTMLIKSAKTHISDFTY